VVSGDSKKYSRKYVRHKFHHIEQGNIEASANLVAVQCGQFNIVRATVEFLKFLKFCAVVTQEVGGKVGPGRQGMGGIQWRVQSHFSPFRDMNEISHLNTWLFVLQQ
jgi:hypothetical protein